MLRERLALGGPARKPAHGRGLGDSALGRKLVFRRVGLKLLERKRQLLYQARLTFRPLTVDLALELGDPQLLLGDQRTVFRRLCTGNRELRRDLQRLCPLDRQCLFQGGDLIANRLAISIHTTQ